MLARRRSRATWMSAWRRVSREPIASLTEPHQHLVEEAVDAPVPRGDTRSEAASDRGEVGELAVVVPEPRPVVADQTPAAGKTVHLVSGLADREERPTGLPSKPFWTN